MLRVAAQRLAARAAPLMGAARPALVPFARAFADDASLLKTAMYDYHVEMGAKMVPFAGHSMPIMYKDSIMEATKHCRTKASLFDVSHMLGSSIRGKDAIAFVESLVVGDIKALPNNTGTLSVVMNEAGGIIDDTVVTKINDEDIYIVLNGGCADKDKAHIHKHLAVWKAKGKDVDFIIHADRSLLAFQGPMAKDVLQPLCTDLDFSTFYFGMFSQATINGAKCWITRTGYTGEDGFEISIPKPDTVALAKALCASPDARLCGLGARDSLRLEAGLCLYGNDLEEHIGPIEAGLTWTIGKSRRDACDFVGGDIIKKQLAEGVPMRRVGLTIGSGAPARSHSKILSPSGEQIGEISSGGFSPVLGHNIAMGYIQKAFAKAGTEVQVEVRGKVNPATVTKMPFVKVHYHKPAVAAA